MATLIGKEISVERIKEQCGCGRRAIVVEDGKEYDTCLSIGRDEDTGEEYVKFETGKGRLKLSLEGITSINFS